MGKRAGVILGVLVILLSFICLPVLLNSFDDLGRAEAENTRDYLSTAAITLGNITLHQPLYQNDIDSVYNITSNETADIPVASSYVSPVLTVDGLEQNANRTLTVYYYTDRDDYNIGSISGVTPFLIFMCLLLSGIALAWRAAV